MAKNYCRFCNSDPSYYVQIHAPSGEPHYRTSVCWWCRGVLDDMFPSQVFATELTIPGRTRKVAKKIVRQLEKDLRSERLS